MALELGVVLGMFLFGLLFPPVFFLPLGALLMADD
jgi:hypothetical protein